MNIHSIPGFPGYGATFDGRIWSSRKGEWRVVAPSRGSHRSTAQGYLKVGLGTASGRKYPQVHTLIALTFIGPKPEGMQVDHIDGNCLNNAASNLEYVTQSENLRRAIKAGIRKPPPPRGEGAA